MQFNAYAMHAGAVAALEWEGGLQTKETHGASFTTPSVNRSSCTLQELTVTMWLSVPTGPMFIAFLYLTAAVETALRELNRAG